MASRAPEFPTAVPALAAERPVTWPQRTRTRLANGLEVVLARAGSIPKFHAELYFRSGNALVSDRSTGLAEMTSTVVRTGMGELTAGGSIHRESHDGGDGGAKRSKITRP